MTYKVFANGFPLFASEINENLMQQVIAVFADTTARDAAVTAPVEGQFAYLTGSNLLTKYNGAAWENALEVGDITGVTAGTALTGGGTSGDVTLNVDLTAVTIPASQISDLTATAAELNYVDGVTSDIQTQIDGKQATLTGLTATVTELNFTDGVTSSIQTQLDDRALLTPAVNAKTGTYTLVAGDAGEFITADGTFTITAPSGTFSAGDRVDVVNIGTGVITFAGSGVTVNSKDAALTIDTQYSAASILFLSSSTAVLIGDIA